MKDVSFWITKEQDTLDCYLVYIPSVWYYTMSYDATSPQGVCIYEWDSFNPDIHTYRECNEIPLAIIKQINNILSD